MTAEEKAALRALAEAAKAATCHQFWDFHHAITPAAVLSLLDEVERLRAGISSALTEIEDNGPKVLKYTAMELTAALKEPRA